MKLKMMLLSMLALSMVAFSGLAMAQEAAVVFPEIEISPMTAVITGLMGTVVSIGMGVLGVRMGPKALQWIRGAMR